MGATKSAKGNSCFFSQSPKTSQKPLEVLLFLFHSSSLPDLERGGRTFRECTKNQGVAKSGVFTQTIATKTFTTWIFVPKFAI
jgi:hypothetical protein